jgi:hypothetical protein
LIAMVRAQRPFSYRISVKSPRTSGEYTHPAVGYALDSNLQAELVEGPH